MAYINFKEENYKLEKQLKKRELNNESIYNQIMKDNSLAKEYNASKVYSFKEIKNQLIGKDSVLNEEQFTEIRDIDIICAKFYNCKFKNVKFKNCSFIGCSFKTCEFSGGGVIFEECVFIKDKSIKTPGLNVKDNFSSIFKNCNIYAKFKSCNLSHCTFEKSILKDTNFDLCDMSGIICNQSTLCKITISDCDFSAFKTYKCYLEDFDFDDKYMTTFNEKTFFDKLIIKEKTKSSEEGIYTIYENLANKFRDNNLNGNFGEYYYLAKVHQKQTLKLSPKIGSYLYWFTCGYGERPLFSIYFSLFIIVLFSILYLIFGIKIEEEIIMYNSLEFIRNLSFNQFIRDFSESLTLSTGMFAGVGLVNSMPATFSNILSDVEMIIGVMMVGVGVGALIRKIIR